MAAPNPATDPLWAYNTSGWTNQGNTGDVQTSATLGLAAQVLAPYDANLNGIAAQSFDSTGSVTTGLVPATNVFYASLIYLPEPIVTTKVYAHATTAGTNTHAYAALLTPAGVTLAATADGTTAATSGAVAWATPAASVTVSSGYYYLGTVVTTSAAPTWAGIAVEAVVNSNPASLVYAAAGPYPKFVTSSSTITITASFPATVTLAAQSTLGAAYLALI